MAFHQGQAPLANLDFPILQPGVYHNHVGRGLACMHLPRAMLGAAHPAQAVTGMTRMAWPQILNQMLGMQHT